MDSLGVNASHPKRRFELEIYWSWWSSREDVKFRVRVLATN